MWRVAGVGSAGELVAVSSPDAGGNRDMKIANSSLETVAQFVLGTAVTNTNLIQNEIKRQSSATACYHSVQNILSSHQLSKDVTIYLTN
jgi:hypothetical protein